MTKKVTEEEKRLIDLLSVTNNVILDGVPGTGKTYIAKRISKLVAQNTGHCPEVRYYTSSQHILRRLRRRPSAQPKQG